MNKEVDIIDTGICEPDETDAGEESMLMAVRNRRMARCAVLRVLYSLDSTGQLDGETVEQNFAVVVAPPGEGEEMSLTDSFAFARKLLDGTLNKVLEIDRLVQQSSEHWTLQRIARIDRNVLRMAVCEILSFPDTPVSVIINEAIEVAKQYGAPDAAGFVNGVLDHAARSIRGVPQTSKAVS